MFTHFFSYLPTFTLVYLYFSLFSSCLPMLLVFTSAYHCLLVHVTFLPLFIRSRLHVYPCLLVFTYVYTCLPIFTTVYSCLLIFGRLTVYYCLFVPSLLMFTHDYSCLPMFTHLAMFTIVSRVYS